MGAGLTIEVKDCPAFMKKYLQEKDGGILP
jgi:hypothetical protein